MINMVFFSQIFFNRISCTDILLSFLESISPTFYWRNCANIFAQIKSLTFTASTKKLRAKLKYKKGAREMLVKLTPCQTKCYLISCTKHILLKIQRNPSRGIFCSWFCNVGCCNIFFTRIWIKVILFPDLYLESVSAQKAREDEAHFQAVAHLSGEDIGRGPDNPFEGPILK